MQAFFVSDVYQICTGNLLIRLYPCEVSLPVFRPCGEGSPGRLCSEWLLEELSDIDADIARVMEIPEAAEFFGAWLEKLNDMIHHADAENWTVAG